MLLLRRIKKGIQRFGQLFWLPNGDICQKQRLFRLIQPQKDQRFGGAAQGWMIQIHPSQSEHAFRLILHQRLSTPKQCGLGHRMRLKHRLRFGAAQFCSAVERRPSKSNVFRVAHVLDPNFLSLMHSIRTSDELQCQFQTSIWTRRGWRGQVPRQPGQIRKEAATTSPTWVDVQPLTLPIWPATSANTPCGVCWTNAGAACSI